MYFFYFLNFLNFLKRLLVVFLIGEHISIRMSPFRFESSCAGDGGMWWIIFQWGGSIFGRRGTGNSFSMSHSATRGSSWPYMDFKLFVTSGPGVGLCPYMTYGRGLSIYGSAFAPLVFGGNKTDHSLLLGFPQTWVLSMWPPSKIKRSYISWWIYHEVQCHNNKICY